MTNLTDEKRKELTLFLGGKCWHEVDYEGDSFCCHCGEHYHHVQNRTFTTPDDMVALAKRMVEKGVWDEFWKYTYTLWLDTENNNYIVWLLIDPARFCWLVSESLGKEKINA